MLCPKLCNEMNEPSYCIVFLTINKDDYNEPVNGKEIIILGSGFYIGFSNYKYHQK